MIDLHLKNPISSTQEEHTGVFEPEWSAWICMGRGLSISALHASFSINKVIIQGTDSSPGLSIVLPPSQFWAPAATTFSELFEMYLNHTIYQDKEKISLWYVLDLTFIGHCIAAALL